MDKVEELLKTRNQADADLEKLKTPLTILFSDIRGSTSFFSMQGDVEGIAMLERHNRILFPIIEKTSGRVVKTVGDAIMAVFKDPRCALAAAASMQQALSADNEKQAVNKKIHIRIGLHSGLGFETNGDVYGDVVNTASRVEHYSEPDEIYISESLVEQAGQLSLSPSPIGPVDFKGKPETMTIYKLDWHGFDASSLTAAAASQTNTKQWVIAAAIGLVLAAGAWAALSSRKQPAATEKAVTANSTEKAPAPSVPNASGITRNNLEQQLLDNRALNEMLEKAGKKMTAESFAEFRAVKDPSLDGDSPVTRGQFAMVLEDLMIFASDKRTLATENLGEDSPYTDVESGQPTFNAIMSATKAHLMVAEGNTFNPKTAITQSTIDSSIKALIEWASRTANQQ